MSSMVIIPPVMTAEEKFARLMQQPAIRERARRDPLFADRLMQMLRVPENRSQGPNIRPQSPKNFARQPVGSTLGATPMSVSDSVRRQRDAFLVADGVQVAGDYTTTIRRQQGGVPAPRMPKVGFPAAQSYRYPSQKMITGAALAGTTVRSALPTASFNPGAFIAARPDSQGNNLITNDPVGMPRRSLPRSRRGVLSPLIVNRDSPSESRRKDISTLMGLSAQPRRGLDAWQVIAANIDNIPKKERVARLLVPMLKWMAQEGEVDCRVKDAAGSVVKNDDGSEKTNPGCEFVATLGAVARGIGRVAIVNSVLADKIDFKGPDGKDLILPGMNVTLNKWLTDNMGLLITDPSWRQLAQAVGFKFPLDIRALGIRKTFIVIAYNAIWGKPIKPEWYLAASNELANMKTGSLEDALRILSAKEYDPDAPTPPVVMLDRGIRNPDPSLTMTGGGVDVSPGAAAGAAATQARDAGPSMAMVIGGGVLAAVLVGAGLWMKRSAGGPKALPASA